MCQIAKLRGNGKRMGDVGFAAFTGLSVMGVESVGNGSFKLGLLIGIEIGCGTKQKLARFCCQRIIGGGRQWGLAFSDGLLWLFFKPSDCIGCDIAPIQSARRFYRFAGWFIIAGQQLGSDLSGCDFAQGGYGWFVVADVVNQRRVAVFQLTCATGGNEGKVEVVRDFTCAVFSSNTGHVLLAFFLCFK